MTTNLWTRQLLGLCLVALGCGGAPSDGPSHPPPTRVAARLLVVSGDLQTADAYTELPQALVVRVLDASDQPVSGQIVNFRVTEGGGMVFAGVSITDADGLAQERWTMGPIPGPQTLEARAVSTQTGAPLVFATFHATSIATAPASATATSGDGLIGFPGALLGAPVEVLVADRNGRAVRDVVVNFFVSLGSGHVSLSTDRTNEIGVAGTRWYLGAEQGAQRVEALVAGCCSATFTATAASDPLALTIIAGDAQSAATGTALAAPLLVRVTSAAGVAMPNVIVTFADDLGSGHMAPSEARTDVTGVVQATWTLGPEVGRQQIQAVLDSAVHTTLSATATASPGDHWSGTGAMPQARIRPFVVQLLDGSVLVGSGGSELLERYDPRSGAFSAAGASPPSNRMDAAASLLLDGRVLITGGMDLTGSASAASVIYDPDTQASTPTGAMQVGRMRHLSTTLATGEVLVLGGQWQESGLSGALSSAELFDPSTGSFTSAGDMLESRGGDAAALTLADGSVLIVGGLKDDWSFAGAERFVPGTQSFEPVAGLSAPRLRPALAALPGGRALLVGGAMSSTPTRDALIAEIYDPATVSFSAGALAPPPESGGLLQWTATPLPDGKVLTVANAWTQVYDPVADTFSADTPVSIFTDWRSAALLPDASVLLLGGGPVAGPGDAMCWRGP